MKRQRSFEQSFSWVSVMLLGMGVLFLGVAVMAQLVMTTPESVHVTVNGVPLPPTEESLQTAHLIFGLTFGSVGFILLSIGAIVFVRRQMYLLRARRLMREGDCLSAIVLDCEPTNVSVNRRPLLRLRCSYMDKKGITYIFKSAALRGDPTPFLPNGSVAVYCDRNDMSLYYVDVDGSIGLGNKVIEL